MLWDGFGVHLAHDVLARRNETIKIGFKEFELVKVLGIHDINTILSIHELDNRAIIVTNCEIIVDNKRLKLLNKASLQVA